MGLRERISKAASVDDIHTLLAEGDKYEYASNHTRASWATTAVRRGHELTKEDIKIKAPARTESPKPAQRAVKHKKRQPGLSNK
jgi:sialic acid synthase SpsE